MKTKPKTFIIFSPAFATEEESIWLPSLQTFVTALNKNFPELEVIVFAFLYPYTTKKYQWHDNTVIPFNGMYKKRAARLLMWLNIFFEVRKIKKKYSIVGIFSKWCGECTFVAKHVSKFFKLKYFCWISGGDARASNNYVKLIQPSPSVLVTLSDFLVDEFYRNHGIRPRHIIPAGVDTSLFDPLPQRKDIDIIGVGSLSILKQYDLFVQIVAALKKSLPGIKAMLCGDGEERGHIEEMMNELEVKDNLTLTGFVKHKEGLRIMQRAKILLHTSSYEGFGTVCIEALYAGAHVISFVQPMYHEIQHWHIVKTTEEMQQKALQLLHDVNTKYESVLAYESKDAAKKVLTLFGYNS